MAPDQRKCRRVGHKHETSSSSPLSRPGLHVRPMAQSLLCLVPHLQHRHIKHCTAKTKTRPCQTHRHSRPPSVQPSFAIRHRRGISFCDLWLHFDKTTEPIYQGNLRPGGLRTRRAHALDMATWTKGHIPLGLTLEKVVAIIASSEYAGSPTLGQKRSWLL